MSSTHLSGNYQARAQSSSARQKSVNPHHLVVEQRAIALSKEYASVLQDTLSSSKYRDVLRQSQKQFLDCDKIFMKTEERTNKINKVLRAIEKQEERICTSLSTVPTIQARVGNTVRSLELWAQPNFQWPSLSWLYFQSVDMG